MNDEYKSIKLACIKRINVGLRSGVTPSVEDLQMALNFALEERAAMQQIMEDMGVKLTKVIVARIADDTPAILSTIDEYIKSNVIIKTAGAVH